jgi:hypothetical protein
MDPIRSRYAGTCVRTGNPYKPGDLVVKTMKGWALAQDRKGNVKVAPPEPDRRLVRSADGKISETDINRPLYCAHCIEADGKMDQARAGNVDLAAYTLIRTGDDFRHERCGRVTHILSESEVWSEVTLPSLHFTSDLSLNRKVGPAMWEKIKSFFQYDSYRDLAEIHDDMDNFAEARHYESMGRGGVWSLKRPEDLETVEDLLGILPENRLAVLRVQWADEEARVRAEEQAASRLRREREAAKAALFPADQGEYVQVGQDGFDGHVRGQRVRWRDGFTIYGGGEEFCLSEDGASVWHLRNNGGDGDAWDHNNVRTGGAGAIGHRFPATPERIAFLRSLPDGQYLALTAEERRTTVLRRLRDLALTNAPGDIRALFSDDPTDARDPRRSGSDPNAVWTGTTVWVTCGKGVKCGLSIDESRVFLRAPYPPEDLRAAFHDARFDCSDNVSSVYLHYPATPERIAALKAPWPAWVGTAELGRFRVDRDLCYNAVDALHIADIWRVPVNTIGVDLGVLLLHVDKSIATWSNGHTDRLKPLSCSFYSERLQRREYDARNAELKAQGKEPNTYLDRAEKRRSDLPPAPPLPDEPATNQPAISEAASKLVNIALAQEEWRQGRRYEGLFEVVDYTETRLDTSEASGPGRSGEWRSLYEILAPLRDGATRTLYRVEQGYWSMGEDGDVDQWSLLFEDRAEATSAFHREEASHG